MRERILLVDDSADFKGLLKAFLEAQQFRVSEAASAADALALLDRSTPDLILLDVSLPDLTGFALCRQLKDDPRTAGVPVILMSGKFREEERQIQGMEEGADDYLVKSMAPRLLLAKINVVLRRSGAGRELERILASEGLRLDVRARTVFAEGRPVPLTRKEFDLLTELLRGAGRALSVNHLLETVWGHDPADYNDPNTVQVHVSSLRRKLGQRLASRIVTVPGHGYRFDPGEPAPQP